MTEQSDSKTPLLMGMWTVSSGQIVVTDPSSELCEITNILDNVKKGRWYIFTVVSNEGVWGTRVAALITYHVNTVMDLDKLVKAGSVGVDTGMAGVFDLLQYPNEAGRYDEEGAFMCCAFNATDIHGGCVTYNGNDMGCVSRSGYGDGLYGYEVQKDDDGEIVAVVISYLE